MKFYLEYMGRVKRAAVDPLAVVVVVVVVIVVVVVVVVMVVFLSAS